MKRLVRRWKGKMAYDPNQPRVPAGSPEGGQFAPEVGKDYGFVFGLDKEKNQTMTYKGGHTWHMTEREKQQTVESPGTTAKVIEYINRPSIQMGGPHGVKR